MLPFSFGLSTLLFIFVLIGQPLLWIRNYRNLKERSKTSSSARISYYLTVLVWEWGWVVVIALILLGVQHPLVSIGLAEPNQAGFPIIIGILAIQAAVIFLTRINPRARKALQDQFSRVAEMLPSTTRERWMYVGLAFTAGVCEELLYRGFLLFYLQIILPGLPAAIPIFMTAVLFGLGHAYQGKNGMLSAGLIGIFFSALYWLTGSLLPSMLLHALVDLQIVLYRPTKPA